MADGISGRQWEKSRTTVRVWLQVRGEMPYLILASISWKVPVWVFQEWTLSTQLSISVGDTEGEVDAGVAV